MKSSAPVIGESDFARADARFEPVKRSKTFNRVLDSLGLRALRVLDLGCGYGEYLVAFGKGSVGVTTTRSEVEYGKARNIAMLEGNVELIDTLHLEQKFEAIWANNLFEHLLSPHAFLMKLKPVAQNNGLLVLGVPVIPKIVSLTKLRKFRGSLASPHINFFTRESLIFTVERAGWKIEAVRPYVFSNTFLDTLFSFFAPHLYIVARNDASFTYPVKKVKEWVDQPLYSDLLEIGSKGEGV